MHFIFATFLPAGGQSHAAVHQAVKLVPAKTDRNTLYEVELAAV